PERSPDSPREDSRRRTATRAGTRVATSTAGLRTFGLCLLNVHSSCNRQGDDRRRDRQQNVLQSGRIDTLLRHSELISTRNSRTLARIGETPDISAGTGRALANAAVRST